ncbi:unnamed protein product [Closterium sp. Yama58-4]|nr:unnamed protein product [Closterium sp. Yama58-4]
MGVWPWMVHDPTAFQSYCSPDPLPCSARLFPPVLGLGDVALGAASVAAVQSEKVAPSVVLSASRMLPCVASSGTPTQNRGSTAAVALFGVLVLRGTAVSGAQVPPPHTVPEPSAVSQTGQAAAARCTVPSVVQAPMLARQLLVAEQEEKPAPGKVPDSQLPSRAMDLSAAPGAGMAPYR